MNKEKTNYTKLVQLMILNNRTLLGLFQIAVIVGISFLLSITSLSDTIIRTKQENAIKTYGKFLVVMSDIDNDLIKDVKEKNRSFRFETFGIGGNIHYSDKKITYGSVDEKMGDTFGFQLLDGKWPESSNQIVIEDYVAYLYGIQGKKLPVSIPLVIDGHKSYYSVTGIISNYSHTLTDHYNSSLETKAYPSIIFKKGQLKHEKQSLVILQKKLNLKTCSNDSESILMKDYDQELNDDNICQNYILHFYGFEDMHDMFEIKEIYRMLLNLLLIIVFIIMIKVILTSNKRTLSLFEAIGLTMMKKRIIILGLTGLILLLGLLMGGMFSSLFGLLYMNKIFPDYSSYYFISLLKSVILECIIIAVILIILFIGYRQNWNESIIQGLNTINRITETQKYKFKKVDFYIIIMQAVCLFVIIASMNFAEMFHFQEKEIVYDLYSKQMDSALPVNGYRVVKDNRELFHFNDISTLKEYDKNITLQMKAETNQSSILIEKNNVDKYWQTYCTDDKSESTPEKRKIWEQVSTEADKYRTIDSVHFELLVLPQKDFLHFLQLKDIQNKALEDNHEKRCVLLIPDYSSAAAETSLQKGENILLGRIENNKGHSVFFKESFKAEEIIDAPKDSNTIQLVISEETAKNSKLILGYDQINVSVNPASPQSVQKEVEEKISLLMASVQGGMLDSSASRNQYNVLMDRFSSILSNSLILFCLCVICIYILMNNYIDWEKNKFEYGVLRSFGMSYSALQHKLFLKYSISILIASTVSIAFGNLAFPHGAMTLQQILIALVITFSITYLCRIIAYYRNRNKPICSMLNRS